MRRAASMIGCVMVLASCAVNPGVTATGAQHSDATFDPADDPFGWTPTADNALVEIGTFTVPIDYNDQSKGKFDLNIARHLAMKPEERIGSLLINPGGPGFGGSDFAIFAEANFGQPLLDHFDIVAWDPRGTGLSEPKIDCIDDYDHYFAAGDITPDDPAERQQVIDLAAEFAANCVSRNTGFYQYVGTNNSARDIDGIRAALGEATISYFGFSYGSELGATWATMFPTTVRAAVFDGAVDPTVGDTADDLQQTRGFEDSLTNFLAACSADGDCPFNNGANAAGAFDELMKAIDATPLSSEEGRPPVSLRMAMSATLQAMYTQASWPQLALALADAQKGDGRGLLELYDDYYLRLEDGTNENALEAFEVISCMDTAERLTVEQDDTNAARVRAVAPRVGLRTIGDYSCTFFPPSTDPRIEITGKGAPPILVMGTTGDPATPLDGTRKMASALEQGRLVVVVGNRHTGYDLNACSSAAVENYLVDPVGHLPAEGLRCE